MGQKGRQIKVRKGGWVGGKVVILFVINLFGVGGEMEQVLEAHLGVGDSFKCEGMTLDNVEMLMACISDRERTGGWRWRRERCADTANKRGELIDGIN